MYVNAWFLMLGGARLGHGPGLGHSPPRLRILGFSSLDSVFFSVEIVPQTGYFRREGSRNRVYCDGDSPVVTDGDFQKFTERSVPVNLAISINFSWAIPVSVTIRTKFVRL